MDEYEQHQQAEARMRELLDVGEMPQPDEVDYEARTVWMRWTDRKVAIAIDLDEDEDEAEAA